jgi:AcrR family transcriptional regulator
VLYVYTVNMDTRTKIIRCALREIERKGLAGFSVRAVGAAAGLSGMAMYRHFLNREDLLRAIGEDAFARYQERVGAVADGSLETALIKIGRSYAEFSLDEPGRFEACFVLKTKVERVYPRDFEEGKSPVIALMTERLRQAQADGQISAADPVKLAILLWAQLHGLVMLHRAGRISMPRAAYLQLCDDATLRFVRSLEVRAPVQSGPTKKRKIVKR